MPSKTHQSYKYLTAPLQSKSRIASKDTSNRMEYSSVANMIPVHWHLGHGSFRNPKIMDAFFVPLELQSQRANKCSL